MIRHWPISNWRKPRNFSTWNQTVTGIEVKVDEIFHAAEIARDMSARRLPLLGAGLDATKPQSVFCVEIGKDDDVSLAGPDHARRLL